MNKLIYTVLFFMVISPCLAQSDRTLARISRDAKTTMQYHEYSTAIELWQQLLKAKPDELEYNYQIGVCYLNSQEKRKALEYLEKVYSVNSTYHKDLEFNLAQAYHYQSQYKEAKKLYEKSVDTYEKEKSRISSDSKLKDKERKKLLAITTEQIAFAKKKIAECENGIKLENQPINASIKNMGSTINSEGPDYTPLLPKDSSFMVFTSRREGTTGDKKDWQDGLHFEDIYITYKKDNKWSSPKTLEINRKYHDAAAALSSDGKTLYLYRDERKTQGDLYESKYDDASQTWGEPKKLNDNINTKYQETSLTLSSDGNTMYFASNRPGGQGGMDIYKSTKDANGKWGKATNIGVPVNTKYDDDAPFLSIDGKSLYFSSRGHSSVGGYDIFKAEKQGDSWGDPKNMGYPINGPDDDLHLVLTEDNKRGYYVSADESGYGGEDIYELSAPKVTLTKLTKTGLNLTTPKGGTDIVGTDIVGSKTPKPDFAFRVRFAFDRSILNTNARESVDNLLKYLNDNETIRIEVGGHTCNIGSSQYNQTLSLRRARAVVNYLVERGIDANRIEVKGYNFSEPLPDNTNRTPAERADNRRAEYKILEK